VPTEIFYEVDFIELASFFCGILSPDVKVDSLEKCIFHSEWNVNKIVAETKHWTRYLMISNKYVNLNKKTP
jgi:hypothetical protein